MTDYFKNEYDPTLDEIRNVFPDFNYTSNEKSLEIFENNYPVIPKELAKFAFKKLYDVTTSFKLSDLQKSQLQDLIFEKEVNGKRGYHAYCDILTPKQIDYVGF
jgi:hypothetical protein